MHVVTCTIELEIAGARSLKEKRQIVRSILKRLSNQFNVAVAEIDHHDVWHSAVIGLVTVGNDAGMLHARLERAVGWITKQRPDVPIGAYHIEWR